VLLKVRILSIFYHLHRKHCWA